MASSLKCVSVAIHDSTSPPPPSSLSLSLSLSQVSTDPFTQCKTPTVFAVGSKGTLTSVDYVEVIDI